MREDGHADGLTGEQAKRRTGGRTGLKGEKAKRRTGGQANSQIQTTSNPKATAAIAATYM